MDEEVFIFYFKAIENWGALSAAFKHALLHRMNTDLRALCSWMYSEQLLTSANYQSQIEPLMNNDHGNHHSPF
jgi:hypothetical protein